MAMTSVQRNVVIAGFLGWTLDAFDFFILVFAAKAIAAEFHVGREDVDVRGHPDAAGAARSAPSCSACWPTASAAGRC